MTLCPTGSSGTRRERSQICYAPSDRDWTEDAAHENGQYQCQCVTCKEYFIGHKRRHVCKKCAAAAAAWWASLTPEQHAIETAKKEEAIRKWFALHNK